MGLLALVEALDAVLVAVDNGLTGDSKIIYFDHVWVGKPNKLPMGARCIAFIEIGAEPDFYYTFCPTNTQSDVDIYITVMSKGHVETAHKHLYTVVDAVKKALYANDSITNTCIASTIESIECGDIAESQVEPKMLATAARIVLKCRMEPAT